jgi:zinc transport system permease protein
MNGATSPSWSDFIGGFELFRDPILSATFAGMVLGYLGVFIVLRRMVFVTAALSQSAGLGVALAFYIDIHSSMSIPPVISAFGMCLLTALALSLPAERLGLSRESALGAVYIVASSLSVVIAAHISQEAHDMASILFGTAVLVRENDLYAILGAGTVVTGAHLVFHHGFLFASFDPIGARVQRIPVRALDGLFWALIALITSVATRALGVLPVFAFAVLPAVAALPFSRRMATAMIAAAIIGALSGGLGYLVAFFESWPVGPAQSAIACAFAVISLTAHALLKRGRRA